MADGRADHDARRDQPLVQRAIARAVADRYQAAADDVVRIIEAAYRVVERRGEVELRLRDILDEAGLSTEAFYRHFTSKDELLLVLLADGRHRLATYLAHRMEQAADPVDAIRCWIEGVLAQSVDPVAASRTRPFLTSMSRLSEQYPDEHEQSLEALVTQLEGALAAAGEAGQIASRHAHLDALAVYRLTFSVMEAHILGGTQPSSAEQEHLVMFCLGAVGAVEPPGRSA
jgi:AcrR family transcriptional regulator